MRNYDVSTLENSLYNYCTSICNLQCGSVYVEEREAFDTFNLVWKNGTREMLLTRTDNLSEISGTISVIESDIGFQKMAAANTVYVLIRRNAAPYDH